MGTKMDQQQNSPWTRSQIIGLRNKARRAAQQGDPQAGFVEAWMNQLLQARTTAASSNTTATKASSGQRLR